jgi:hypothetical protein
MKERPILMSAPMVRAVLAGTKTQTRRAVKPIGNDGGFVILNHGSHDWPYRSDDGDSTMHTVMRGGKLYLDETPHTCPYGKPGDRLWVRETWARDDEDGQLIYRADVGRGGDADDWQRGINEGVSGYRWRPSIHMPRAASRILLEITAVRVERLQDISEADAAAEGARPTLAPLDSVRLGAVGTAKDGFLQIWESINGAGSWEANPWVWCIEFRRLDHA